MQYVQCDYLTNSGVFHTIYVRYAETFTAACICGVCYINSDYVIVFTKHIHRKLITNSSQKRKSGTYYIITNSIWLFVLVINAKRKFLHLEQATALWSVVNCSRLIVLHKMIVTACDKLFYIFNLRTSINKDKIFKKCFISWFRLSWKVNRPATCT